MRSFHFLLVLSLLSIRHSYAVEVSCEKVENSLCFMTETTFINSSRVTIADERNENITAVVFFGNKKITFLPIRVHEKMPNLLTINANDCAIRQISKRNFEQLRKLQYLYLGGNQIEKILSDTFEDLVEITWINLGKNRIKFMYGKIFEGKPNLSMVDLSNNVCISITIDYIGQMEMMRRRIVTERCGFNEDASLLDIECGTISKDLVPRVQGGRAIKPRQWPFLVALLYDENFFCGGNLISRRHVLTAAHCLHDKQQISQLAPKNITVLVGRHDLKSPTEFDSEMRKVSQIIIHHDWRNNTDKYHDDLAIIVLDQEVTFSESKKPVCLTSNKEMLNHFNGTIVGWGKAEGDELHENIPREAKIRAVTDGECFERDHDLGVIYSRKSFCAGGEGAGICAGDSGGGYYVNFKGLWTLKGVVSAGAIMGSDGLCNVTRLSLFTKLADYSKWIKDTVEIS